MKMPIKEWIPIGNCIVAVDEQNDVCGILKRVDDKYVLHDLNKPQNKSSKASGAHAFKTRWKGGD